MSLSIEQARAIQRKKFLAFAAKALAGCVAGVIVLVLDQRSFSPEAGIPVTVIGQMILRALPNAVLLFVIGSGAAAAVCVYLAYARWVTRRLIQRHGSS